MYRRIKIILKQFTIDLGWILWQLLKVPYTRGKK